MTKQPIIVFDSGVGGLSIYRPLKAALPTENIVYQTDSNNFPYGDKSADWLAARFVELAEDFAALNPKLVVLACNSATTNIISQLRLSLSCPVVGVEPVIKPLSVYQHPLALMTESAATSKTTSALLEKYGSHIEIYVPKGLATAIEFNEYDQVKNNIHELTEFVQQHQTDAIGLSCTHYPLILPQLQKALPQVVFIDPSAAVVREVLRVLESSAV
jgi:glutamate racemase